MTTRQAASANPTPEAASPRRVLLVDDSASVRGFYRRALEGDPSVTIVASVGNGRTALDALARNEVDVVVLDIEMPVMDGLTALPQMLAAHPGLKVLVASGMTPHGAEITCRALLAGAAECIAKPSATDHAAVVAFHRELLAKVKALADARHAKAPAMPRTASPAPKLAPPRLPSVPVRAIAIASSTGGPSALLQLVPALQGVTQPVFITQHMPAHFTATLAEHLARSCGRPVAEAADGETVRDGRIYVAPGDWHMLAEGANPTRLRLSQAPPVNFCRPSADPMLATLAAAYGSGLLGIFLTGMGADGLAGAAALVAAGGTVIAQDQASSVVWGMPGAVAHAGLCSAILPLDAIGRYVREAAMRRRG